MAKPNTREAFRQALADLRFAQMQARLDARSLATTRARCRQLGRELRRLRPHFRHAPFVPEGLRPLCRIRR